MPLLDLLAMPAGILDQVRWSEQQRSRRGVVETRKREALWVLPGRQKPQALFEDREGSDSRPVEKPPDRRAEIVDLDLTGGTAASIGAIQLMRPTLSGRKPARHPRSGARRENRRSWRPHEANAGIIGSRNSCRPRERVTFHNAENGFCVLQAKARGHRDLVTVVGHAAIISAGEWITASGEWINDRAHGQQFKARFLKTSLPSSIDGVSLASSLVAEWLCSDRRGRRLSANRCWRRRCLRPSHSMASVTTLPPALGPRSERALHVRAIEIRIRRMLERPRLPAVERGYARSINRRRGGDYEPGEWPLIKIAPD